MDLKVMPPEEIDDRIMVFLKREGKAIKKENGHSIKTMINLGKTIPRFGPLLEELILEGNLSLNDLLYATMVLIKLGRNIPPRTYLAVFNSSLEKRLEKQNKTTFTYENNDVLIGEIVSVFNSLILADQNQRETVESLLGSYQWYKAYKNPLGLVKDNK
jgi:hypothetical protein